jgi:glucoside 3-dehydrogenase (cytochrome c) hitch-hiker subunit
VGSAGAAVTLTKPQANAASACRSAVGASVGETPYSPRFFSRPEFRSLAALAETVIPTDDHSPGAEAAGVHEFMDDMIADSDSKTQAMWREGLAAVENASASEFGKGFAELGVDQRIALLEKFAANESNPATSAERFFVALKRMTIEGYYTSSVGIHQDLNYQGNTAMADFPGCKH